MWDGCNSETSKAIKPSRKAYEEHLQNQTRIKYGVVTHLINQPGEEHYTTHRMGEDFFGMITDGNGWHHVTKSVPKHHFGINTKKSQELASESEKFSAGKLERKPSEHHNQNLQHPQPTLQSFLQPQQHSMSKNSASFQHYYRGLSLQQMFLSLYFILFLAD